MVPAIHGRQRHSWIKRIPNGKADSSCSYPSVTEPFIIELLIGFPELR